MCVQSVTHELEFTIWGNETDGPVVLKTRKSHTLVEFDILHLDGLASRGTTSSLEHGFVVQPQSQLWHSTEITLHLNCTQNLRTEDISVCRNQQVKGLNHIQEDFILAIAYPLATPGDGICDGDGWSCLDVQLV